MLQQTQRLFHVHKYVNAFIYRVLCVSQVLWSRTCGSFLNPWWRTSCTTTGSKPPSLCLLKLPLRSVCMPFKLYLKVCACFLWAVSRFCHSSAFRTRTRGCRLCSAPVRNYRQPTTTTSSESLFPCFASCGPLQCPAFFLRCLICPGQPTMIHTGGRYLKTQGCAARISVRSKQTSFRISLHFILWRLEQKAVCFLANLTGTNVPWILWETSFSSI